MNKYKDKFIAFCKKNHRSIKVWAVILVSGAMVFKGVMQMPQIHNNKQNIVQLQEKIEYEKIRQSEIDELKDEVNTDEYIEKIASEKLGLVKNNAKIFVDVSEGQ